MWCHQHFGKNGRPDIIAFGKKTQVCGLFASKRFEEIDNNVFQESSRLNSTWGGNLTDMVRFSLYLDVIEKDKLLDNTSEQGKYLLDQLIKLQSEFPDIVLNARGRGLFCAIDLPSGDYRDKLISLIQEEGALMLGCGPRTLRFRPNLNISKSEIEIGADIIRRALKKLKVAVAVS
jgi:L-lysine 6-transaminase